MATQAEMEKLLEREARVFLTGTNEMVVCRIRLRNRINGDYEAIPVDGREPIPFNCYRSRVDDKVIVLEADDE